MRALPALLAFPAALGLAPSLAQDVPFERLAKEFLEARGYEGADPGTFDFEAFLEKDFVRARLGLFEVYMMRDAAQDKSNAAAYQKVLRALLDAQGAWLDWLDPMKEEQQEARADLKTIATWVKSARGGKIAAAAKGDERELFAALVAKASQVEAADRFAELMGTGGPLGLSREDAREPLIVASTRREFMQLISLAGWLRPDLQSLFWQPQVVEWTNFYVDEYKVLALEFAAPGRATDDYESGASMNDRVANGMEQQITQLAMNSLIDGYYGARIPPSLAGGLAVNLVIDVFGECNTRVDGDLRERRTDAIEVFVPGGQSEGGVLPKISAESRWREDQGADRFVSVLRTSQKKGASKARGKDKLRHFALENDAKNERFVIHGPYLGSAATASSPPQPFRGDHLEFLRSYRTCFVHWLRSAAAGSSEQARQSFATLLRELAAPGSGDSLEAVFERVYGARLSSEELSKDDLEGAFLRWVKRR